MKPLSSLSLCAGLACVLTALPALAQDVAALTAETKKAVLPVVPKVVGAMQKAVAEKGVVEAIPVCKDTAPKLIQEVRDSTGWSIKRVSSKARNPERATPDAWESATLAELEQKLAAGTKADALEKGEIVEEGGKTYFRYAKALPAGEVCLSCHGPAENLDPALKAKLKEVYPNDQATGYHLGQIRGILSVKRPL